MYGTDADSWRSQEVEIHWSSVFNKEENETIYADHIKMTCVWKLWNGWCISKWKHYDMGHMHIPILH